MIKYSPSANRAFAFLFRPYNDIDIYIEDTANRNMWEHLLNRMLDGRAKVTRIFQLGGRDAVIQECKDFNALRIKSRKRRTAFLIDGDFDVLLKRKSIALPFLYQLNVYCVENLLYCNYAVIELAYDSMVKSTRLEAENQIAWKAYVNDVVTKLRPLFITYGIVFTLDKSIETTGYHVSNFYDQTISPFFLSKDKIDSKISEIRSILESKFDNAIIDSAEKKVLANAPKRTERFLQVISGKTYLLPYLLVYLHKTVNYRGNIDQFKTILARHCKLDQDKRLAKFLRSVSKN